MRMSVPPAPDRFVGQAMEGQALKVAPLVAGPPPEAELTPNGSGGLWWAFSARTHLANLPTIAVCHDVALSLGGCWGVYWQSVL